MRLGDGHWALDEVVVGSGILGIETWHQVVWQWSVFGHKPSDVDRMLIVRQDSKRINVWKKTRQYSLAYGLLMQLS